MNEYRKWNSITANICNGYLYNIVFCRSLISQEILHKDKYSSNPLEIPNFELPDFKIPDFDIKLKIAIDRLMTINFFNY